METREKNLTVWLGIPLLMALGGLLRGLTLARQSFWYDDFGVYRQLSASSLRSFVTSVWGLDSVHTEHVPLYYFLQYAWVRCLGLTPVMSRLLPLCLGLLTIPVIFAIGRRLFGARAGWIAALCFSLSPYHLYQDQALRPYALLTLLALLSLWALLRAVDSGQWRWWGIQGIFSAAVVWTHLMGVFFLAVPGLYLLWRKRYRAALFFAATQLLLVLGPIAWIAYFWSTPEEAYAHYVMPGWQSMLLDLIADDAIGLNKILLVQEAPWATPLFQAVFGLTLALFFALVLLCSAWRLGRSSESEELKSGIVLMLTLCLLPVALLFFCSLLWRPCLFPRYSVYAGIGVYVLTGAALSKLPKAPQALSLALLTALLTFQLAQVIPYATRTRWFEVAQEIREKAAPEDLILAGLPSGSPEMAVELLRFHLGSDLPIAPLDTPVQACEYVAMLAHAQFSATPKIHPVSRIWVVFQQDYQSGPVTPLEECLTGMGALWTQKSFQAMECLELYQIPVIKAAPESALFQQAQAPLLRQLALAYAEVGAYTETRLLLDWARQADPQGDRNYEVLVAALEGGEGIDHALQAIRLLFKARARVGDGKFKMAEFFLAKAVALFPTQETIIQDYTFVLLQRGLQLAKKGKEAQARLCWRRVVELDPERALMVRHLLEGDFSLPALEAIAATLEAFELLGRGEEAKAVRALEEAGRLDPQSAFVRWVLARLHLHQGNYARALDLIQSCLALAPEAPQATWMALRAALGLGEEGAIMESLAGLREEGAELRRLLEALYRDCDLAARLWQDMDSDLREAVPELALLMEAHCADSFQGGVL